VDESYFDGVHKGKKGRGIAGKVAVFGLLKRGDKVFTLPVDNTRSDTLIPIIAYEVQPDSTVYTDSYRSYDVLDITNFHHYRINHSKLFVDKQNHINSIENFGIKLKGIYENIMAYQKRTSIYSSKNVSLGLIMNH